MNLDLDVDMDLQHLSDATDEELSLSDANDDEYEDIPEVDDETSINLEEQKRPDLEAVEEIDLLLEMGALPLKDILQRYGIMEIELPFVEVHKKQISKKRKAPSSSSTSSSSSSSSPTATPTMATTSTTATTTTTSTTTAAQPAPTLSISIPTANNLVSPTLLAMGSPTHAAAAMKQRMVYIKERLKAVRRENTANKLKLRSGPSQPPVAEGKGSLVCVCVCVCVCVFG